MKRFSIYLVALILVCGVASQHMAFAVSNRAQASVKPRAGFQSNANAASSDCLIIVDGDVNTNGLVTSGDIIYHCNYIFKGQAAPLPCRANGDVNCNGSITSADVIFLVNYCFKGGPAPCDICNNSALAATCN